MGGTFHKPARGESWFVMYREYERGGSEEKSFIYMSDELFILYMVYTCTGNTRNILKVHFEQKSSNFFIYIFYIF